MNLLLGKFLKILEKITVGMDPDPENSKFPQGLSSVERIFGYREMRNSKFKATPRESTRWHLNKGRIRRKAICKL